LSPSARLFPFAQLDFAGDLPLADGRYLVRSEGEASEVVIVATLGAPPRRRWRRARPREVARDAAPEPLTLTRVTVVKPRGLGEDPEATGWLEAVTRDDEAAAAFVDDAVRLLNRALHAHATAAQDPYAHEVSPAHAAALRIGYGEGEQVAEGLWSEARELARREPRRRRADSLQPQERVARVLGGRERVEASETLLLRARLDLDQGREREAALQLRAGLSALLAEPAPGAGAADADDIAELRAREADVERLSAAALRGDAEPEGGTTLADTLARCERVLRRRRLRPDL
jgi:hypothetical protein